MVLLEELEDVAWNVVFQHGSGRLGVVPLSRACGLQASYMPAVLLCEEAVQRISNCSMLKSTVQTLYFVGTISGDFGFGILADVYGRKPVIVPLLLILSLTGTIAALVPTLTGFIAVRFLNAMADMGIFSNIMCWLLEVVGGMGLQF